jgi:hypothetical protein
MQLAGRKVLQLSLTLLCTSSPSVCYHLGLPRQRDFQPTGMPRGAGTIWRRHIQTTTLLASMVRTDLATCMFPVSLRLMRVAKLCRAFGWILVQHSAALLLLAAHKAGGRRRAGQSHADSSDDPYAWAIQLKPSSSALAYARALLLW